MKRLALLLLAACTRPGAGPPTTRPAPAARPYALVDLVGDWRWVHQVDEEGTSRVEDERWRLAFAKTEAGAPLALAGRYLRTVDVRSLDRVPFQCDQRLVYRQRALYDVSVESTSDGFILHETGYTTEPSPCDHGFRKTGDYRVEPHGNRLVLHFDGGTQTLWQVDDTAGELPAAPWPTTFEPAGAWRWSSTAYDEDGNVRDETEWWEITRRSDDRLDATYRRRVTVRSPDGKPIACANAPSWTFDDAYVLEASREDQYWHFHELAVEPGDHPCLRATPKRNLDEAIAEQIGDYLVLDWRGKRRQVLYRPALR